MHLLLWGLSTTVLNVSISVCLNGLEGNIYREKHIELKKWVDEHKVTGVINNEKTADKKIIQKTTGSGKRQRQCEKVWEKQIWLNTQHNTCFCFTPSYFRIFLICQSSFFFFQGSHSPRPIIRWRLSISLSLSPCTSERERQEEKSTGKRLLTWRNEALGHFQIQSFFYYRGSSSTFRKHASFLFYSTVQTLIDKIASFSHEHTKTNTHAHKLITVMEGRHHMFKDSKQKKR